MGLQRNFEISEDSYIDRIKYGLRSHYIRYVLETRLDEVRGAVAELRLAYGDDQIMELVDQIDMPRRVSPLDVDFLPTEHRACLVAIAYECELTGMSTGQILLIADEAKI